MYLLIDATDSKAEGEGEWNARKRGEGYRAQRCDESLKKIQTCAEAKTDRIPPTKSRRVEVALRQTFCAAKPVLPLIMWTEETFIVWIFRSVYNLSESQITSQRSTVMFINKFIASSVEHGQTEINRIDYLDGWRGVAIILVLLSHFFHINYIDVGRLGVDIFFVLSGMLMANILFVKKTNIKTFYKRRISRIMPVFIIYLSVFSLISMIFNLSEEHKNFLYNLTFLRAYFPPEPDLWNTGLPVGHLWSLNVEEHSYLLLSFIAIFPFLSKRAFIPILALGISAVGMMIVYGRNPDIAPPAFHLRTEVVASFLLISAGYSLIKHKFIKFIPSWLPILAIFLTVICYSPMPPIGGKWLFPPFLLAFAVNHLDLTPRFLRSALCYPLLRLIGVVSYSIYIWQQPLYYYFSKFGYAFYMAGPVLFVTSIIIGMASFYFIENPARRYLNNRW